MRGLRVCGPRDQKHHLLEWAVNSVLTGKGGVGENVSSFLLTINVSSFDRLLAVC